MNAESDVPDDTTAGEPTQDDRGELPGSHRPPVREPRNAGALPDDLRIEATLILRRRNPLPPFPELTDPALPPEQFVPLEREQFAARYGADPHDVEQVIAVITDAGAEVIDVAASQRRIRIAGTVPVLSRLFGTRLSRVTSRDADGAAVSHRYRIGPLTLPGPLAGIVTAVLGLDDRPQAHVQFRVAPASEVQVSYTPPQLGGVYGFPADTDGSGQIIALIELGGGFDQADLDAYFAAVGVGQSRPAGATRVTAVGVDGAANKPGSDPSGADAEVLLDIEVAGALAPGADIVVYFAPNTDAGFVDAVSEAAHAPTTPTAISISWGQSEDEWTGQARTALDDALADAAALGVTVTAAAGDSGSSDRETVGAHVDFPASSPHTVACGGTSLRVDPTTGEVMSETVWNNGPGRGATGGGISDVFGLPPWQDGAGVPPKGTQVGRGVPDVAANADPQTGYWVRVDGRELTIGGTSAVAPLWAALVSRLAQGTGRRLGLIQPQLYSLTSGEGFRDITVGDNGAYDAGVGWDACTGLGVPVGTQLAESLTARAVPDGTGG